MGRDTFHCRVPACPVLRILSKLVIGVSGEQASCLVKVNAEGNQGWRGVNLFKSPRRTAPKDEGKRRRGFVMGEDFGNGEWMFPGSWDRKWCKGVWKRANKGQTGEGHRAMESSRNRTGMGKPGGQDKCVWMGEENGKVESGTGIGTLRWEKRSSELKPGCESQERTACRWGRWETESPPRHRSQTWGPLLLTPTHSCLHSMPPRPGPAAVWVRGYQGRGAVVFWGMDSELCFTL